MTVHTTYFGGLPGSEPADDAAVYGVVRYPRDFVERITDRNIPVVAPPADLLDAYKTVETAAEENGEYNPAAIAWDSVDYERRYLEHLDRPVQRAVVDELTERARECDIWLVCWEKDARWCHRRLLANEIVADLDDVEIIHYPDPSTIPIEGSDETEEDNEADATLADFAEAGGA